MILADFHTHTTYCDGKNTPEEMVKAAIAKGMTKIGFSGHSHTAFDESYCMSLDGTEAYRQEIAALKEKYRDKIEIYCGIEQDLYSEMPTDGYDYVIGSVHYLKVGDNYYTVDESAEKLKMIADKCYGGDFYALAEDYFDAVASLREISPSIIGHFDLVAKFNQDNALFDENHPRYIAAAKKAIDALLPLSVPFEINTGAIARGYRDTPYPAPHLLAYIKENGGKVILSGDAHSTSTLCYAFDKWEKYADN